MNLSIREHIINNFKGDDYDTLRRAIDESVASQDEVTLPGLGVFLEIIWENADQELKNQMIDIIKKRVEKGLEEEKKESWFSFFYCISLKKMVFSTTLLISVSLNGFFIISTIGYVKALSIVSFVESPEIIDTGISCNKLFSFI